MSNPTRFKVVDIRTSSTNIFQLEKGLHENIVGPLVSENEACNEESDAGHDMSPMKAISTTESDILKEDNKSPTIGLSCQSCGMDTFPDLEEQREHYRSDHHRMNIRRRVRKLPPISLEDFEQLLEKFSGLSENEEESDVEELFSQLEIEDSEDENQHIAPSKEQKELLASPIVWFQLKSPPLALFGIYRSLIPDLGREQVELALANHNVSTWGLILLGGGHFVAAIFDNSRFDFKNNKPCVLSSKTFHRYTVRRKQGGAQSGNDNSKGKAKSAGANIRRQMESMLREDIRLLLEGWQEPLSKCSRLYVRAPSGNQKILYPNSAFTPQDERLFTFPFTTRRPTLKEAQRCYIELVHPKKAILEIGTEVLPKIEPKIKPKIKPDSLKVDEIPKKPKPQKQIYTPKVIEQTKVVPDPITLDLIDSIVTWIQTADLNHESPSFLESLAKIQNCEFLQGEPNYCINGLPGKPTLLQLACQHGQAKLIKPLLEFGCDPSLSLFNDTKTAFQLAKTKSTKLQFRIYRFHHPDQYDWEQANVPPPISPDELDAKLASQKLKKKEKPKKKPNPPPELPQKNLIYSSIARGVAPTSASGPAFSGFGPAKPTPSKPSSSGFKPFTGKSHRLGFDFDTSPSKKDP